MAPWNVRTLYITGGLDELRKYKLAIQGTRWPKLTPQAFASNGYNIYTSSLTNKYEFETAFFWIRKLTIHHKYLPVITNFTKNKRKRRRLKINSMNSWNEPTLLTRRTT
jgi:hypothetical protein